LPHCNVWSLHESFDCFAKSPKDNFFKTLVLSCFEPEQFHTYKTRLDPLQNFKVWILFEFKNRIYKSVWIFTVYIYIYTHNDMHISSLRIILTGYSYRILPRVCKVLRILLANFDIKWIGWMFMHFLQKKRPGINNKLCF
jgi:hypothetical protein